MNPRSRKSLLIGVGNSLRGDDALGPIVAGRMLSLVDPRRVRVLARQQLTPDLAADLADMDCAIFVDATVDGPVRRVVCREIVANADGPPASHQLHPVSLLALTETLYGRAPRGWLITVRGESFELADTSLTPAVAAQLEAVLDAALRLVGEANELSDVCEGS